MTHLDLTLYLYAPAITIAAIFSLAAWVRNAEGNLAALLAIPVFLGAATMVLLLASGTAALLLYCGAV